MNFARRLTLAGLACLAARGLAAAAPMETATLRLTLTAGQPARLENRLTDEVLELTPEVSSLALLWHGAPASPASLESVTTEPVEGGVAARFTAADDTACRTVYRADPNSGEIAVAQTGASARPGVCGIQWGLAGLDSEAVTVIVPGMSGLAFHGPMPASPLTFSWPMGWEAGMVLLQMARGGFLIWARDPDLRYKALALESRGGRTTLRLQSENPAPFANLRAATSVEWRVRAYRGDWRQGAALYRDWLLATSGAIPLERQQPAWVQDIRFLAIVGMDTALIEALAQRVDARQTMLYVPGWRRDPYDMNYPDYTADERFPAFVEAAHRLGFRVMVHVNYFGCDPKNALYEQFKAYQLRSPHSGALEWWTWPLDLKPGEEPRIRFAYIHPGLKAWRDLLVERYREIVETHHVDALHLDQTLCMPNHAGGLVEDLNVPQGNRRLHQELRVALPQTALSGEGLDEVTMPFEALAQRHAAHAVDHVRDTWNDAFIACGHPISSFLFLPCTTVYGYLGMNNPAQEGPYNAWRRAYQNWGVIPTFARPTVGQVESRDGLAALLLEEAAFWTRHHLRPDFAAEWTDRTRFRWSGDAGAMAAVEALAEGGSRLWLRAGDAERELYRYIHGVRRYPAPGQIAGWLAFDDTGLLGLDPRETYLYTDRPRDPRAPHLSALSPTATLVQARQPDGGFVFALDDVEAARFFDVTGNLGAAHIGVSVNGAVQPLERGASFAVASGVAGGVPRQHGIFAHPPWHRGVAGAPLGETFGEFVTALPAGRGALLTFALGLRDGVNGRSDGVTYRVQVDGTVLFEEHWAQSAWAERQVDLSAYAGRQIRLRLVTTPGPADDPSFDWAMWGDPLIRLLPDPAPQPVAVTVPHKLAVALASGRAISLPPPAPGAVGLTYKLPLALPGSAALFWRTPTPVSYPVDLAAIPSAVSASIGGRDARLPMQYVGCGPGKGTSHGVERPGLVAHPPNAGRVYADYLIDLPAAGRVRLRFAVGMQDGSTSTGCRFIVDANGATVFERLLTSPDGWHDAEVDLSAQAGGPLLLSLMVDAEGSFSYDWARWAEPVIEAY